MLTCHVFFFFISKLLVPSSDAVVYVRVMSLHLLQGSPGCLLPAGIACLMIFTTLLSHILVICSSHSLLLRLTQLHTFSTLHSSPIFSFLILSAYVLLIILLNIFIFVVSISRLVLAVSVLLLAV
jgi:hypothetical protein